MDDDLGTVLDGLRAHLDGLQAQDTIGDHSEAFCDDFYKLYWLSREDLSAADSTQILRFLSESSTAVDIALGYLLQDLINRMTDLLNTSFQSLEWIQVCEMRSTFEALMDMYADHIAVGLYLRDTQPVDDLILAKSAYEARIHETLTPVHFPPDHWWWGLE